MTAQEESRYPRRVVCAAVKLSDGRVVCGVRHFDKLMREMLPVDRKQTEKLLRGAEQGFADNRYQFMSRQESWEVAVAAKQFDPTQASLNGTLFSEDVW